MRCIHIGLLCVQPNISERPTMASVVLMLTSNSLTLPVPSQPFSVIQPETPTRVIRSNPSQNNSVQKSVNEASLTELFPPFIQVHVVIYGVALSSSEELIFIHSCMKTSINPKRYTTTRGHKFDKKLPMSKQQTNKQENPSGSPNKVKSWKINQAKLDEQTKQHPNPPSKAKQH
ncbi:cysteine-rich receptor-like protein kinase 10 [Prunus yedoensis var. nudiflora]|uniref:Cysteine-rich receptor-like protein kinase 10 n=1 Tax=Prunus yedoensis var. nudiflora TaxID=2094558 RepID=A0A314UIW6_PRUYE|nr:cysteine-rich receptor-like protein kinase 10 [Prunus yedoensis var. nudiflora]